MLFLAVELDENHYLYITMKLTPSLNKHMKLIYIQNPNFAQSSNFLQQCPDDLILLLYLHLSKSQECSRSQEGTLYH